MTASRRVVAALLATGSVLAVAACGTTDEVAATVGDQEISVADFERLAGAYQADAEAAAPTDTGAPTDTTAPDDPANDTSLDVERDFLLDGGTARDLLGQVILGRLIESFLTERDALPSAEELATAPIAPYMADLPADLLQPLQLYALGTAVLAPAVGDTEAAEVYDGPVSASGFLCPRIIVTETEDEALDIVDQLEDGADFAELAGAQTYDETLASAGGVPAGQGGTECLPAAQLSPDAPVGLAALPLTPGEWTDPVEAPIDGAGTMGWFVLLQRPYEEVSAEVAAAAVGPVITEYAEGVEVEVSPRYGRWDADQFAVVAP